MQLSGLRLGASSFKGTQIAPFSQQARFEARRPLQIVALKDIAGTVVSVHMSKTAVVEVNRFVPHRIYGKRVRRTRKFFAHDEEGICDVGDTVRIVSIPPISKKKAHKVEKVLARGAI